MQAPLQEFSSYSSKMHYSVGLHSFIVLVSKAEHNLLNEISTIVCQMPRDTALISLCSGSTVLTPYYTWHKIMLIMSNIDSDNEADMDKMI